MIQDSTKSQEELAAKDERYRLKITVDRQREKEWSSQFKLIDASGGDFERITWEEALEGKGFFIKKNEAVFNGRISDIWRAKKKDSNEELCVKVVRLKAAPKHYLQMYSRRNLKVLQALNHASIVKVHKIFALQSNDKVFIFMDYGEKGSLSKMIKKQGSLNETLVIRFFKDVAEGLQYMHSLGLAHRTLSTDLIVITAQNRAKICGLQTFGEICDIDHNNEPTPCWMTHDQNAFISPEALCGEPHCPFAEDIWSVGVAVYTCLCGGYPFDGYKDRDKLTAQIKEKTWAKKDRSKALSAKARQLLETVFQLDYLRRPIADELVKDKFFVM